MDTDTFSWIFNGIGTFLVTMLSGKPINVIATQSEA